MNKKDLGKLAIALHKKLGGKIAISSAMPVKSRNDLSLIYTPGVAAVSSLLATPSTRRGQAKKARDYTIKKKMVAVISDGSAVLGLGNIGPYGALPVMEGKCALFKEFAGVEAFPLVLDTQDPDEIIETVMRVVPAFGGINLEDIAAPQCFYIEEELKRRLDIPVMHDDQHGTAIAVLAALINAARVVKKDLKKLQVVILGAGAAGTAVAKLLLKAGLRHVVILDSKGIVHHGRRDLSHHKKALAHATSRHHGLKGELKHALPGADVLIGVSGPNLVSASDIRLMAKHAIVLAMANPTPEISPEEAKKGGAMVVGTGRSDYPNQINNSLVFPGVFRGALDHGIAKITDTMKLKAAKNLASLVKKPTAQKIIPGPFEKGIATAVARAIR